MATPTLDLVARKDADRVTLHAPEVGTFTRAVDKGGVLTPGAEAGVITQLGRSFSLRVPEGVRGVVVGDRPDLVRSPVGWGDVLYELAPIEGAQDLLAEPDAKDDVHGLVLRSPSSGRFWQRPAPDQPAFVTVGDVVEDGKAIGLVEIMKTFSHVPYRPDGSLPQRGRIVRMLADDGADVRAGDPLIEVEPA